MFSLPLWRFSCYCCRPCVRVRALSSPCFSSLLFVLVTSLLTKGTVHSNSEVYLCFVVHGWLPILCHLRFFPECFASISVESWTPSIFAGPISKVYSWATLFLVKKTCMSVWKSHDSCEKSNSWIELKIKYLATSESQPYKIMWTRR